MVPAQEWSLLSAWGRVAAVVPVGAVAVEAPVAVAAEETPVPAAVWAGQSELRRCPMSFHRED